jgi:hypothetical protein
VGAIFYAFGRPFHLCRDEIGGHTGFDHGFKTVIVLRRPCSKLEARRWLHFPFAFSPPRALASVMFTFLVRLRIADSLRFISAAIEAACFPAAANL